MKNIHKFIIHVTNNLFPLNEYSEGEMKRLMDKFKEEADDLNIEITDEQLKLYIERFDQIKNSPKITEKDLRKYSLNQLIRLVSTSKGAEAPEQADITPDVVYSNEDNSIVIYNGSKEGNCVTYGRGESWCITRGSYGNYRYSDQRGYPTFYLAKNNNLSSNSPLSFVAIQVRNIPDENKKYVYTNRKNSPYESSPMSFSALTSEIPWLNDIPNIKNILKYIPLSNTEKLNQQYKNDEVGIRDWLKFPYSVKEQYLVIRKDKLLFNDISNDEFVGKYLPKIPQLATFVAINAGVIKNGLLLKHLDKFSTQDRKSITANMREPVELKYLKSDDIPFDVKKLLTQLNKWNLTSDQRIYNTKDGKAIVLLTVDDTISMGIYTEEDDYPNVKLNQRTSKYLLEYSEIDKIPFKILLDLNAGGVIGKQFIDKILEKAKEDPNSAIVIKDTDEGQILLDANSFVSYKVEGDKFTRIPFTDEAVQKAFEEEKENNSFQESAVNMVKTSTANPSSKLSSSLDKDAFLSILKATPYDKRKITRGNENLIIIPTNNGIMLFPSETLMQNSRVPYQSNSSDWRSIISGQTVDNPEEYREYFAYLRNENKSFTADQLLRFLESSYASSPKKAFLEANPPLDAANRYRIVTDPAQNEYLLINTADPRTSKALSPRTGKLVAANIPPRRAAELLGTQAPAQPGAPAPAAAGLPTPRRRGRPAGATRAAAPAAPAPAGGGSNIPQILTNYGLEGTWNNLNTSVRNRFANSQISNIRGDRGASRRDNLLGGRGRVIQVISSGNNKMYIIRLANGQHVASVVLQPGNIHLLMLPTNTTLSIGSPDNLVANLQQRNLAEVYKGLAVKMYLSENPNMLEETKELLRKHLNR